MCGPPRPTAGTALAQRLLWPSAGDARSPSYVCGCVSAHPSRACARWSTRFGGTTPPALACDFWASSAWTQTAPPTASSLGDRPAHGEYVSKLGIKFGVLGVGRDAKPVENLAEEAARCGGEHDVEDLAVGQPVGAQPLHVCL